MRYESLTTIPPERFDDLMALYRSAWWSAERSPDDVRRMLAGSNLVFALAESQGGRVVAFARVLTDGVYKAMVFDVIVHPDCKGEGLGQRVMEEMLAHPDVARARHVELYCLPELEPFYERWGFIGDIGGVRLVRRTNPR